MNANAAYFSRKYLEAYVRTKDGKAKIVDGVKAIKLPGIY
jgi:hypothetical protein